MTIPQDFEDANDEEIQSTTWNEPVPIPVVVKYMETENVAPDSTSWTTFNVPQQGTAPPVMICPHRYKRYKAKFQYTIAASTTLYLARTQEALSSAALGTAYAIGSTSVPLAIPDYDGMQALYAVFTGTGPVSISVMDEGYKPVQ